MSITVCAEKIDVGSFREIVEEFVAVEVPVNIFLNNEYVITLLATPEFKKELALGWLFDEGVLLSLDEVKRVTVDEDSVHVVSTRAINKESLRVAGVSRVLTTACGLSTSKFFKIISGVGLPFVASKYKIRDESIIEMTQKLGDGGLFRSTGGVHVAALFEEERLVAFVEDVGRHNTVDKAVGIGIQEKINFSNSVIVNSGRQPADMVLKAARMGIPIVVSRAAPIRSGIITADKTGVTLTCFVRNNRMNVYTHSRRIITSDSS